MTVATRPFPPPLATTRWELDAPASRVAFSVRQLWGLSKVHGRFARSAGVLELDADGTGGAVLCIEAASIETGNRRRDRHLREPRYFDCDRHPVVRFIAAVAPGPDGGLALTGEIEAAGRGIALDLVASVDRRDARLELAARAHIDARELGMSWSPAGNLKTPVALAVLASLRRVD